MKVSKVSIEVLDKDGKPVTIEIDQDLLDKLKFLFGDETSKIPYYMIIPYIYVQPVIETPKPVYPVWPYPTFWSTTNTSTTEYGNSYIVNSVCS